MGISDGKIIICFCFFCNLFFFTERVKKRYVEMIASFKSAWALVGYKLKHHGSFIYINLSITSAKPAILILGRLPVEEKYCLAVIDDDTSMEYLIPTTSEAGVCSTALVDFLALSHNKFIEKCKSTLTRLKQRCSNTDIVQLVQFL